MLPTTPAGSHLECMMGDRGCRPSEVEPVAGRCAAVHIVRTLHSCIWQAQGVPFEGLEDCTA